MAVQSITDPSRYFSVKEMEREYQHLWPNTWLLVAFAQDLENAGDFVTFDFGRENILLSRVDEDSIKAFYNVCPHRGNRLVHRERGNQKRFVCNYHSWSFNHDGSVRRVTDEDSFSEQALCGMDGLSELRCETFGLFVFITMNPGAPPLEEYLGPVADILRPYNMENMRLFKDGSCEVQANWKVMVDAFTELYHIHMIHPEALEISDDDTDVELLPNGCGRVQIKLAQSSPRSPDRNRLSSAKQAMLEEFGGDAAQFAGRDIEAGEVRNALAQLKRAWLRDLDYEFPGLSDEQIVDDHLILLFPNVVLNIQPDALLFERWVPDADDPQQARFDTATFFIPTTDSRLRNPADGFQVPEPLHDGSAWYDARPEHIRMQSTEALGFILNQDFAAIPMVQKGLRSRGFKGVRWSEQEALPRYHKEEIDRYLAGHK